MTADGRTTIRLGTLCDRVDRLVERGSYDSRSEAVREAVRILAAKHEVTERLEEERPEDVPAWIEGVTREGAEP